MKAGDAVVTYDCEGVTVGCSICYDLRFPDLFQALAEKGAQMIALPAAFTLQTGKDHWETLLRARAIETADLCLRRRADRLASPSATSSARPTAIRWSPTPGAMSSPRRPTASASSRPGSTWPWSSASAGMIPVAQHKVRLPRA